ELRLGKRFADGKPASQQEGIGYSTTDDQLIDFARKRSKYREFGRNFGSGHNRNERSCRLLERPRKSVDFGAHQRTRARHFCKARNAMRRRFGAMRGAECIVDVDVAKRSDPPREILVVFFFAFVEAAV